VDLQYEWASFSGCHRPIHVWLMVSYATVVAFRMLYLLGASRASSGEDDFLLNLRQKGTSGLLSSFTWLITLPFFTLWTVVGTWWLRDVMVYTPNCLPVGAHSWFIIFWQALSYIWILVHAVLGVMAWALERRLRRSEADLRRMGDADTVARWGQGFSQLGSYASLTGDEEKGLTPAQIGALASPKPWVSVGSATSECGECECAICINELQEGEIVRTLTGCNHTFHKSCIDLWLLRRADCPLCKRNVCSPCAEEEESPAESASGVPV